MVQFHHPHIPKTSHWRRSVRISVRNFVLQYQDFSISIIIEIYQNKNCKKMNEIQILVLCRHRTALGLQLSPQPSSQSGLPRPLQFFKQDWAYCLASWLGLLGFGSSPSPSEPSQRPNVAQLPLQYRVAKPTTPRELLLRGRVVVYNHPLLHEFFFSSVFEI